MCISFFTVVYPFAVGASTCFAGGQPPTAPPPSPLPAAETADVTKPFRRPGELVGKCGAATVTDLGLWPDHQAAFEKGEVLEFVNLPLGGCINALGQVVVPLAKPPAEGVTRAPKDGLVQYVVKNRLSAGRINARGDLLSVLLVDNPIPDPQPLLHRTVAIPAETDVPIVVSVPAGMRLEITGLNDRGIGVGNMLRTLSGPNQPQQQPYYIDLNGEGGKATVRPVFDQSKLPSGLMGVYAWRINNKGEVLLNMQRDTGVRHAGMFIDKEGVRHETCPNIIETVSQSAIVRGDNVELLPLPKGMDSFSASSLTEEGEVVGSGTFQRGEARLRRAFVWRDGKYTELRSFDSMSGGMPTDADDRFACGWATLSSTAMQKAAIGIAPDKIDAFNQLRGCGVLWDLRSGAMLPLDALLSKDGACTHITAALAMKGNKVLCTGVIAGKLHGVIVTLPPRDKLSRAFTD